MRRLWIIPVLPAAIWCLGVLFNVLAVTVNHGVMPVVIPVSWPAVVVPGQILDPVHIVWNSNVHLGILCDWIQIDSGVCSIGDLCLWLGDFLQWPILFVWIFLNFRRGNENF